MVVVKIVVKFFIFVRGNNLVLCNFLFLNVIIVVYGKNVVCVYNIENF